MDNNEKKKKEPWRIIVGIIAIAYIVYVWVEKDIITIVLCDVGPGGLSVCI